MNEIGLKPRGDFDIPFKDLKPGTLYYYRMFATEDPTSYENPGEPTRRWANGAGRFITASADGKPGQLVPFDTDRYIFLGTQWGSRWYSSFSGPAGSSVATSAISSSMIALSLKTRSGRKPKPRRPTTVPANDDTINLEKTGFTWKSGIPPPPSSDSIWIPISRRSRTGRPNPRMSQLHKLTTCNSIPAYYLLARGYAGQQRKSPCSRRRVEVQCELRRTNPTHTKR